ncbi:MAG: hypothetical protein IK130_10045 [Oscillospiraceae bacterium]|nr:hypothetical protein [Oscillospiraceae bacterium]
MKSRKILSAFLAAMLAVSGAMLPASADNEPAHPEKPPVSGDVNCDGKITVSDAVLIARINAEDSTVQLNDFGRYAADANQDGDIDSNDLTDILRYIAGIIPTLSYKNVNQSYSAVNLTKDITIPEEQEAETADGFRASQLNFTANLLKAVAKEKGTEKNMLISPYSVAMALAMTTNGAKGDTLAEMEKVLGDKLDIAKLNDSYLKILLDTQQNMKDYSAKLDIANSIWYHQDPERIKVPEQFLRNTVNYYHASAYAAKDFDEPVINDINSWVFQNTHGMINGILPKPQSPYDYADVVMILVNALAFEADWSVKFRDDQVVMRDFTLQDGTKFKADMMYCEESDYFESEKAVGFKKYYDGWKYSYIGILPNEDITVENYIANLDEKELETFLGSATDKYELHISMPKYSYDFDASLKEPLINMGMPTAFDDSVADFTGLDESGTLERTAISDVLHKTYIKVDQNGTKAGAVTAVIMAKATSVGPSNIKNVNLDRPFLYMIYDEEAKLPVFIGTVMQPDESEKAKD